MSIESIVPQSLIVTDTTSGLNQPESAMRRKLVQTAGAASLMSLVPPLVRQGAWAQGSDAPVARDRESDRDAVRTRRRTRKLPRVFHAPHESLHA